MPQRLADVEGAPAELAGVAALVAAAHPGSNTPKMAKVNVPKSAPQTVAQAIVEGLRDDAHEVWAGEGAKDLLQSDPASLFAEGGSRQAS